ncbi:MAG TPA: PQQ-binding-like beta-propeller repeat protein [Bryobacteraceae bacterium]|jgi:polyvinyl alcohol dehydrogenase (cytochrome)|nr:PQQ-binding-like beta-propeller repeat protein [Bryobacteraceae bacterium]
MRFLAFVAPFALLAAPLLAAPSGEEVYKKRCGGCHEQVNDRIPPRDALQRMPSARILRALNSGAMMAIAFTMSGEDRQAVATYLGTSANAGAPPASAFCADRSVKLSSAQNATAWNGWSPAGDNARFQPAAAAKLTLDQVRGLKLKWAFGFDGDVTAFAPPAVIDGQVFIGSAAGLIHAMRASSGCLQWVFQANGPVRSSIQVASLGASDGNKHALLFGDMTGWFYAVEAESGKLLWKVQAETHDSTRLTGGPAVYEGTVYVPVASWEETRAGDPEYACCTFRGSVLALRISDGKQLWKTYMTDAPVENGKSARGTPNFGPSGVGVWSAPTLDIKRKLIYVATGDNYSPPATDKSDAIVALDMATGKIEWSRQITPEDVYSGACGRGTCGPDFDFGSSPILTHTPDGREMILAGQKSGIVWGLDPAKKGEIIWQTRVGIGSTNGGVQWGMATDGQRVFASVSDLKRLRQPSQTDARRSLGDPNTGGGLTALRVADGKQEWHVDAPHCPEGAPLGCSPSQPGAVTEIPGVVFSTSTDGHIRAHTAESGQLLWDFNTMRDFETVNKVKARGGSIDGPGAVVVNGMVFITSGYPRNGGVPGNVLLAFVPE